MGTTVAGLAPGLSRKLKKVLESRIDTPDLLSSLNTLSSFYDENTPQARRNLRSTIEKRSLSINHEFLDASQAAQLVIPFRFSTIPPIFVFFIAVASLASFVLIWLHLLCQALDSVENEVNALSECCDRCGFSFQNVSQLKFVVCLFIVTSRCVSRNIVLFDAECC